MPYLPYAGVCDSSCGYCTNAIPSSAPTASPDDTSPSPISSCDTCFVEVRTFDELKEALETNCDDIVRIDIVSDIVFEHEIHIGHLDGISYDACGVYNPKIHIKSSTNATLDGNHTTRFFWIHGCCGDLATEVTLEHLTLTRGLGVGHPTAYSDVGVGTGLGGAILMWAEGTLKMRHCTMSHNVVTGVFGQ